MPNYRSFSKSGFLSISSKVVWILTLVTLISTPGLMEEEDEHETKEELQNEGWLEILESLKSLTENPPKETELDSTKEDVMTPKVRKAATNKPKFDPGFKWMGLGKRPSVPIGPHMLSDLRIFFETARNKIANEYLEDASKTRPEFYEDLRNKESFQDRKDSDEALKFVHRSKESGERKNYYNPSLLWTGLGR